MSVPQADRAALALASLVEGRTLPALESEAVFDAVLDGTLGEARTAALLTALRARGESPPELAGAVRAARRRMLPFTVPVGRRPLLDTCGTGGDGSCSLNVSTAVAIVAAAAGAHVAKHGNRSASGNSGSSDVLAELGVAIDASPAVATRCLEELGITFLFAPAYHPALRGLAALRRQLPFRTIFNLIGPLANPARPDAQLIGVPSLAVLELFARTCDELDADAPRRVLLAHGEDGLDEVSITARTRLRWVGLPDQDGAGALPTFCAPAELGVEPDAPGGSLRVSGPAESARRIHAVLAGTSGPDRDVVVANTAVALRAAGLVTDWPAGVERARDALDSGAARRLLDRWARLSQQSG